MSKYKTPALIAIAVLIFSCAHQKKIKENIERSTTSTNEQVSKNILKDQAEQLTFHGNNSQASYSPDGNKFIYVSSNRYSHTNSQVYEYSFTNKEENRIIFQDGESANPIYSNDGAKIIFASSTDEIKENPLFLYNKLYSLNQSSSRGLASDSIFQVNDLHAFELYEKDLINDTFTRLTHSAKLDNNMSFYDKRNSRLFTSVRGGNLDIYKYRPRIPRSPVRLTFSDYIDDEAEVSPINDDYIWVRYGKQSKYSQILFSNLRNKKQKHEITFGNQFHINPTWHPNGEYIYFSSTDTSHKNYQLYVMNKNGECKTRITTSAFNDTEPSIDPKLKSIIFTREKNNNKQIYRKNLTEPSC